MTQYNPSALSGEMTLADLFAAYAPKKIPEWFQPQLPYQLVPKPETFVTFLIGREDRELFTMYYDSENSTWDENRIAQDQVTVPEATRKALADWKEAWDTYFEVDAKYKKDDPIARLTQWPYHYAKLMLEHRQSVIKELNGIQQEIDAREVVEASNNFPINIEEINRQMSHTTVEEEKPLEVYRLESQPIIFPRIIDGIEKVRPGLANSHVIINKSVWTLDDLRNLLTATCDETFFIQDNRLEYLGDKELTLRIHIGEQTEILHFKNAGKPYYGEEMSPEFTLKALLITNPYPLEVFKITIGDDPANRHQGLHTTINNSNELCSLLALAFSRGKRFFKSNGTMWIWATGEPFSCTINDTIHLNFLPINS